MPYRRLDAEKIIKTADILRNRIGERFPDSSLCSVASELVDLAGDTRAEADRLEGVIWWLRIVIALVIVAGALVFVFVGSFLTFDRITSEGLAIVQGIEASINTIVLASLGLYTLIRLEERFKRQAALKGLHTLRSVIHVIDMHQLTKDPTAIAGGLPPTASSPKRLMSPAEHARYLDYCSEMLSIIGKVAALYAQAINDDVVVAAVNDIETLSAHLSRKIWQKIVMIEAGPAAPPAPSAPPAA